MLRVLALLCSFVLLVAPLVSAQAEPACAMLTVSQDTVDSAHGADHQMPSPGHPAQSCKQLCAVVAILAPPDPAVAQSAVVQPSPRPVASLLDSQPPGPSERPPKHLV
jgi:hypothetical protein